MTDLKHTYKKKLSKITITKKVFWSVSLIFNRAVFVRIIFENLNSETEKRGGLGYFYDYKNNTRAYA